MVSTSTIESVDVANPERSLYQTELPTDKMAKSKRALAVVEKGYLGDCLLSNVCTSTDE